MFSLTTAECVICWSSEVKSYVPFTNKPFIYSRTPCVCDFTPSSRPVAQPICCLDTCALFLLRRFFSANLFVVVVKLTLSLSLNWHVKISFL